MSLISETPEQKQLRYARSALSEWDFREDELGDRTWQHELTDDEVRDRVERDYPGGWRQFVIDEEL